MNYLNISLRNKAAASIRRKFTETDLPFVWPPQNNQSFRYKSTVLNMSSLHPGRGGTPNFFQVKSGILTLSGDGVVNKNKDHSKPF